MVKIYAVEIEQQPDNTFRVTIEDRSYVVSAEQLSDFRWKLQLDNTQTIVAVAKNNDQRFVHSNGEHYTVNVFETRRRRNQANPDGGLTAQMPGQILEVLVQPDEAVEQGQTLIIMEAMKMEIRVSAPSDGIVQQVFVQQGDVVETRTKIGCVTSLITFLECIR